MNETDQQARYNRRKIGVAVLFSLPYVVWAMFFADKHPLLPRQLGPLALLLYLVPSYFVANGVLRWLAKKWP